MKYYILTTAKFAEECVGNSVYGSTNSNWLANIEEGDCVFISQFNSKSQSIFGPFRVCETLFYDKTPIYPKQKFYYRIKIEQIRSKSIDETDIYLEGLDNDRVGVAYYIINLIQQNKHLHSISLNNQEGKFILATLKRLGKKIEFEANDYPSNLNKVKVDTNFLARKNKIFKKHFFSSESDLESFMILNLKNRNSHLYAQMKKILNSFPENGLNDSEIYNQFIFGNAYPADIVVANETNVNIFELKRTLLNQSLFLTLRKEMRKYCYYSLFSSRLAQKTIKRMNFFLLILKDHSNPKFKKIIYDEFRNVTKPIDKLRENNFSILEYYFENDQLLFEQL